eukprot:563530-Hanusia_phi.AAC.2
MSCRQLARVQTLRNASGGGGRDLNISFAPSLPLSLPPPFPPALPRVDCCLPPTHMSQLRRKDHVQGCCVLSSCPRLRRDEGEGAGSRHEVRLVCSAPAPDAVRASEGELRKICSDWPLESGAERIRLLAKLRGRRNTFGESRDTAATIGRIFLATVCGDSSRPCLRPSSSLSPSYSPSLPLTLSLS